ncbi:hypothetical protein L1987_02204 [Smallanthus sonchifolius]|uniref:Uncharacterized protein n=1 Tax=Smallanthus sonchifolius TaxID=185202 RepID=A0ACB9K740_9ASTR|nr:hypothetical protein L1987_02204 [Smallanthus sonchifolius]
MKGIEGVMHLSEKDLQLIYAIGISLSQDQGDKELIAHLKSEGYGSGADEEKEEESEDEVKSKVAVEWEITKFDKDIEENDREMVGQFEESDSEIMSGDIGESLRREKVEDREQQQQEEKN